LSALPAVRVVSLVPSVTETLLAWGIEPVGCTRFCEQPDLHHVGGTKDPDISGIVALRPDLVVVDREENRREDAEALLAAGLNVMDLHVVSVESALSETHRLAQGIGAAFEHDDKIGMVAPRVTAFVPIWRKPWMTINRYTYGASLLSSIGVAVSHADTAAVYPIVDTADMAEMGSTDVNVVLLPTEPYAFSQRHVAEVASLTGIADVRSVDGRDLFWWGVRTRPAQSRLAAQLADLLG
jgi:ABC-type Fe3+-hydroxamate transport system substrate-binding protein